MTVLDKERKMIQLVKEEGLEMECYAIGDIVRDARQRHGLTQEELAFNICSVSTLSKIETGSRRPHCSTFEALMERMGEPMDMQIYYIEKRELERRRLIRSLEHGIRMKDEQCIQKILNQYRVVPGKENPLDAQWRCLAEVMLNLQVNSISASEGYLKLTEVMQMTRPDFTGKWISDGILYTHCEAMVFQVIAGCQQRLGIYPEAEIILQKLLGYYQRIYGDEGWEEAEISVYQQLAELYFEMGQYSSSADCCAEGIRRSLSREYYHFVSALLTQWACIMAELGNTSESCAAAYHAGLLNEIRANQKYLSKFL